MCLGANLDYYMVKLLCYVILIALIVYLVRVFKGAYLNYKDKKTIKNATKQNDNSNEKGGEK